MSVIVAVYWTSTLKPTALSIAWVEVAMACETGLFTVT